MDRSVFWRAALLQAASVGVAAAVLIALPLRHAFFEDWGWLVGPGAWAACALLSGRVLRLPWAPVLVGAALSGVPALLGVAIGEHWPGTVFGIPLFALWCAKLARDRGVVAEAI